MIQNKANIFLISLTIPVLVVVISGCDLFKNEGGDWKNDVTIRVENNSDCLVDLYIDGVNETSMSPLDEYEKSNLNRGIHLLEAYPWNDEQFSCDHIFTPDMASDQTFDWLITNDNGCGQCDPTPTSVPDTPTPSPTPV